MFGVSRVPVLRILAVLLAVAFLSSLAAACEEGGGGGTTPEADESPQADAGDGDGGGGDDGGGDEDGAAAGGGELEELAALASEAAGGVTGKVTYSVVTETDGDTFEGEWVLVQRPPDSRMEIAGTEGGEEFRTIIISSGGKGYLCFSSGGEDSCLATETEGAEAEAAPLDPLFQVPREISDDVGDVGLVDESQREIAGVDATCFTVESGLAGLGEGEICFSDGGLLLRLASDVDGTSSVIEATSVSTDVTDADFEPPFDILELPDFEIPEP